MSSDGKAYTTKQLFSRETQVSIGIKAQPETIWAFLTDAAMMPAWNSTLVSVSGDIQLGQTIQLVSKLDPSRTFRLKIKAMEAPQKLVWGDGMGQRTFTLTAGEQGHTQFTMAEKIGGPLFPLFARMIPDFGPSFEQFAADLKQIAESEAA